MGVDLPVMLPLSLKSGRRWGRRKREAESLVTIASLFMLSVGVGGGAFKGHSAPGGTPEDAPTFWG